MTQDTIDFEYYRESSERYGKELDAAAEILQRLHPIGACKGLGRMEVVAALRDVTAGMEPVEVPSCDEELFDKEAGDRPYYEPKEKAP